MKFRLVEASIVNDAESFFDESLTESDEEASGFIIADISGEARYFAKPSSGRMWTSDLRGAKIFKRAQEAQELIDDQLHMEGDFEVRPLTKSKANRQDFINVLTKYDFKKLTPAGTKWEKVSGDNFIKVIFGTAPSYKGIPAARAYAYSEKMGDYPDELYHSATELDKFIRGCLKDFGINESLNEEFGDDDDWDEWDVRVDWTYAVDKNDLYQFIFEECIDAEDFLPISDPDFDPNNAEDWDSYLTWIEANYDEIFTKYERKILDHFEQDAIEDAEANYDPEDHIDWDVMPGGHDDYDLNDFINESKEEKICCICKEPYEGYGNNAEPVCSGSCCDKCNMNEVIPARMRMLDNSSSEDLDEAKADDILPGQISIFDNFRKFVEMPAFRKAWKAEGLTDEDLRDLQNQILNNPENAVSLGDQLFKIRFSPKSLNKGKSGGYRVFYIDAIIYETIYLVDIINKSRQDNINSSKLLNLREISTDLRGE